MLARVPFPGAGDKDLSFSPVLAFAVDSAVVSSLSADVRLRVLLRVECLEVVLGGDSERSTLLLVDGVDLISVLWPSLLILISELSLAPLLRVLLVDLPDSLLAVLCCDSVDSLLRRRLTLAGRGVSSDT